MNFIGLIILGALLLGTVLELAADLLNLGRMRTELPEAFRGWYDPQRYAQSQRYLQATTRFGWVTSAFNLLVLLIFWFGGGFAALDRWVRALNWPVLLTGLAYIGILVAARAILSIPFSLYATFVIEERFGFNKTNWATYLKDRVTGALLAVVLGGPLLAAILSFFQYAGPDAWWMCWIAAMAFILVVQYIAPTWIMPLFNRFEPLPPGALRESITAYAESIDFALNNILVMDGSRRSTKSNAFFTGFGRHRRIVLFDTLIARHSVNELVAVLAHEMGHYKQGHVLRMMVVVMLQAGLMFYILSIFISYPGLFEAFYLPDVSVYAGLVLFGLLYAPIEGILSLAVQALSRRHEYQADRFAATTAPDGKALAAALKKLSADNLTNLQPHSLVVFLHYSHPPVLERVQAIEAISASP
jgi:STE24 endopeptidase